MTRAAADYQALVTPQHATKPKFMATVGAVAAPFADQQALAASLASVFDLDSAVGVQLDVVGKWAGRSRYIPVPLANLWFSWGNAARGWGKGIWKGPYDQTAGITELDDDTYRSLLRAKIAANSWDGRAVTAQVILDEFFGSAGTYVFIQDNQDMSQIVGVSGAIPSSLYLALLAGGYVPVKPAGVKTSYMVTTAQSAPLFGFGVSNQFIDGWGVGAWGATPDYIINNPL
jgi:hypothetical protein